MFSLIAASFSDATYTHKFVILTLGITAILQDSFQTAVGDGVASLS